MKIFVSGLWAGVSTRDLDVMVRGLLRGPWYKLHMPRGMLAKCDLLQLTERGKGRSEYAAVISVEPQRLGWEVVQQLDGAKLQGRTLHAHRWFPRVGISDRRAMSMNDDNEDSLGSDRRAGRDRRRRLDIHALNRRLTQPMSGFQRSYGS